MTSRSGEYPSTRAIPVAAPLHPDVRHVRDRMRDGLYKPPAKVATLPSDPQRDGKERATAALRKAVDELIRRGWSYRTIGASMGCSPSFVYEMTRGTRRVADWVPWKLPHVGRAIYTCELAATVDEGLFDQAPPSATGTEGR